MLRWIVTSIIVMIIIIFRVAAAQENKRPVAQCDCTRAHSQEGAGAWSLAWEAEPESESIPGTRVRFNLKEITARALFG